MKKLAALRRTITLSCSVKLYFPSKVGSKETDVTEHIKEVASKFTDFFGGATTLDAIGYWHSPQHGLVAERVKIIQSFCTSEQLKTHIENVVALAGIYKQILQQEAIALEVNNELHLI